MPPLKATSKRYPERVSPSYPCGARPAFEISEGTKPTPTAGRAVFGVTAIGVNEVSPESRTPR
jgi:hypothetical protein